MLKTKNIFGWAKRGPQSYRYAVKHNLFICNKNMFPPMTLSKKNNNIKYLV